MSYVRVAAILLGVATKVEVRARRVYRVVSWRCQVVLWPLVTNPNHALLISLDYATPQENDAMRAPGNFEKVIEAIPKLLAIPLHIRVASTIDGHTPQEEAELNQLIETLGIPKEDHIVRKIIHRGRAQSEGLGINASIEELMPELTLTVDGAFWSPFAPTYKDGRLQQAAARRLRRPSCW